MPRPRIRRYADIACGHDADFPFRAGLGTDRRRLAFRPGRSAPLRRPGADRGRLGYYSAHEATSTHLLFTEDARRDAALLWLADHAAPGLREAAAWLARMVEAEIRFGTADLALLEAARAALAKAGLATLRLGGIIDHAPPAPVASLDGPSLMHAVAAVDRDLAVIDHLYERQKAA